MWFGANERVLDWLVEAEPGDHGAEITARANQCRDNCKLLAIHKRNDAVAGALHKIGCKTTLLQPKSLSETVGWHVAREAIGAEAVEHGGSGKNAFRNVTT